MSELDLNLCLSEVDGEFQYELIDDTSGWSFPSVSSPLFFDTETKPHTLEVLQSIVEYKPKEKKRPGEFDPSSVKYGNTKDPAKREAKLEEAKKRHALSVREFERNQDNAESEFWESVLDAAALDATRSSVLTIQLGTADLSDPVWILHGDEQWVLSTFWDAAERTYRAGHPVIGYNCWEFDIPYICRRSVINDIGIPGWVFSGGKINSAFYDVMFAWKFGQWRAMVSLAELGAAMGVGRKQKLEVSGKFVHELWASGRRDEAIEYMVTDIVDMRLVAQKLSLVNLISY